MKRSLRALCVLMALLMLTGALPVAAEKPVATKLATIGANQMQINNNTGASITEVYIYPNYSNKVGDARNKGWIKKQQSGIISMTAAEARRDCLWNMTVVFKPQGGYAFRVTWEDLEISEYLGQIVEFTVTDNGYYNMRTVNMSGNISFDFYNDTGYAITELYFFTANSNSWGNTRNNKQINDQSSITVNFNSVESSSSASWCLRALFRINWRDYYVEFEDVDLSYYDGGTMIMSTNRDGELYIERMDDFY